MMVPASSLNSAQQNLADAFVNAGFGQDRLMIASHRVIRKSLGYHLSRMRRME